MTKQAIPTELLDLVERPEVKEGKVVTRKVRGEEEVVTRKIKQEEVLNWSASSEAVCVVTVDGQKFRAEIPAEIAEKLTATAGREG